MFQEQCKTFKYMEKMEIISQKHQTNYFKSFDYAGPCLHRTRCPRPYPAPQPTYPGSVYRLGKGDFFLQNFIHYI